MKKIFSIQFLKFAGIGVLNTVIDLVILNSILFVIGSGIILFIMAKSISFLGATLNSFFWNKHWTFKSRGYHIHEAGPFLLVSIIAFVVNVISASFFFGLLSNFFSPSLTANLSAILASLVALLFNFFGYKHFVFSSRGGSATG